MNQEILQTGGLMFYGRDLAQRWIFVRVGGVRRVVVREVSSLRCRMAMTLGLCAIAVSLAGCGAGGKLPDKSSKEYAETVSAFYTGLAALQVGDDVTAESKLAQVTQLAPGEPAGWANWGVLAFRQRNFDVAAQRYDRARELAPKNDQIYYLLGILQSTRGNSKDAIADWRKAVGINPQNYRAAYQLALEVEREGGPGSDAEFESLIQNILKAQPDNLAAWLELARAAAKRGDSATLKSALAQINARASQWPPEVQQQVAALQVAVAGGDMHAAAMRTTFLRNTLMRVAEFRESLGVLQAAAGEEAEPFTHFLRLEPPAFVPAPADLALTFTPQAVASLGAKPAAKRWEWIGSVSLGSAGPPVVVEANGREVHVSTGATFPFAGGAVGAAPLPEGILPIDFN
ncbi:MAG: tetratricopeptide repeat protein [Candidatus Acidiferrales bacterium]